ncbi:gluconokinase [Marinicrinis lubricantis]|uniref:Gluconokinase n=1 Tax=Marinicrinis lubricantis TaxID=2086470 RepID=A0ABW1IHA8_9BACL
MNGLNKQKQIIVAIDIGTTSAKCIAIHLSGRQLARSSVEYPLFTPQPDRAEQDPEQIWQAVVTGVQELFEKHGADPKQVLCFSFSSAMHALIAMSTEGKPLTPSIIWADSRSTAYVEKLRQQYDAHGIYRRTGTPIHPMSPLLKLMWMNEEQPELFQAADKFIGIKEYVLYRLFGRFVMDYSLASATGLYNLEKRDWDEEALRAAGITADRLPELVPTTAVLTGADRTITDKWGIAPYTPFIAGASDGVLANLGIGAVEEGVLAVTIGTSGAVRSVVGRPATDEQERLFCYVLTDDQFVIGGAVNNGGVLFRWVRDELATLETSQARDKGVDPYTHLTGLAAEVPPGSDGLLVLPLFMGERAPYWNADTRGVFFGLSLYHTKKHMIRAVLEGICFAIRSVTEALRDNSGPIKEIRASGGFAQSPFWCQLLADILGVTLKVPESVEGSSYGAAVLALQALGMNEHIPALLGQNLIEQTYEPNTEHKPIYDRLAALYQSLYEQLEGSFKVIVGLQK